MICLGFYHSVQDSNVHSQWLYATNHQNTNLSVLQKPLYSYENHRYIPLSKSRSMGKVFKCLMISYCSHKLNHRGVVRSGNWSFASFLFLPRLSNTTIIFQGNFCEYFYFRLCYDLAGIVNNTRDKSSYATCDEAWRAKSQEIIWYEL